MVFRCGPSQHFDKAPINGPSPSLEGFPYCSDSCLTLPDTRTHIIYSLSCLGISKPIAASTSMTNFSLLIATSTFATVFCF